MLNYACLYGVIIAVFAVVVDSLRMLRVGNAGAAEAGLRATAVLASNSEGSRSRLATAGACEG